MQASQTIENVVNDEKCEDESSVSDAQEAALSEKQEIKEIISHVRQNFGKINVAPEFSQEDLVPIEVDGMSDISDLDSTGLEEQSEEEEDQVTNTVHTDNSTELTDQQQAEKQSSKTRLKELDDRIAKCKKFLDKAKAKRFSALR